MFKKLQGENEQSFISGIESGLVVKPFQSFIQNWVSPIAKRLIKCYVKHCAMYYLTISGYYVIVYIIMYFLKLKKFHLMMTPNV